MRQIRILFVSLGAMLLASYAPAQVDIYVGYADGIRGGGFFPNPWDGDPGVSFFGASGSGVYDAGAIMLVNTGAVNVTLDQGFYVDNFNSGGTSFQLWDGYIGGTGHVIAPGDKVILTQTSDYNFDTSDYSEFSSPNTTYKPLVHLSLDGSWASYADTGQVLNTAGFDLAGTGVNESYRWRLIGTDGSQAAPEPATLAALGLGFIVLLKKRKK